MPYDLPDPDGEAEKGKERDLGGSVGKTGWGRDQLDRFAKSIKKASCSDVKPTVTLDGCYTAMEGGIAEQVAARGIGTTGFTGSCDFGYDVDKKTETKEYHGPEAKKGGTSEKKSFEPR
jgi:hypothetical protein